MILTQTKFIFKIIFISFIICSCWNPFQPNHDGGNSNILYFNSFESSKDTIDWQGYGGFDIRDDAPPKGGDHSLFVTGGCLHPHAYIDLKLRDNANILLLRCWGKNLEIGGVVTLGIIGIESSKIAIAIDNKDWQSYQSIDSLFCFGYKNLRLSISAGGFAPSSILVDLIEIIELEKKKH
jgi:hypothetical protein